MILRLAAVPVLDLKSSGALPLRYDLDVTVAQLDLADKASGLIELACDDGCPLTAAGRWR